MESNARLDSIISVLLRTFKRSYDDVDDVDTMKVAQCIKYTVPEISLPVEVIEKRISAILQYQKQLEVLLQQPYIAQRTPEWYALRKQRLTASDTAQALGVGKFGSRNQLIQKKAGELQGIERPFVSLPAMKWGTMFEAMALRCYQQRNMDIPVHEFGLIPHPNLSCYGASPDGISDIGIMIEIKCPYRRKITGEIPDYYELQMQGQMAVCGLKECDYIECDMQTFQTYDDYFLMVDEQVCDHGIICEVIQNGSSTYHYSPEKLTCKDANAWVQTIIEEHKTETVKLHYWKLRQISIQRVYFDEDRWNTIVPKLVNFWNEVVEESKKDRLPSPTKSTNVNANSTQAVKKAKYDFIVDSDDD